MGTTFWHSLTVDDTLQQLGTRMQGLAAGEVAERLALFGHNEIRRRKPVSPLNLFIKQFANFFVVVLLFAAALAYAVSFLPGEEGRRLTAFFILGIIALSVALSFFQEFRAQKELEALDRLLVSKAVVIRAGVRRQVDAAEVVPGDARLIEAYGLRADEAVLTGESAGVDKSPQPVAPGAPLVAVILLFVLREPPVDVALNTLSLAVATILESLPIVLTFALAWISASWWPRRSPW